MKPKTRARLNRPKSLEITQKKLGLPSIDPPLGALPVGLGTPPPPNVISKHRPMRSIARSSALTGFIYVFLQFIISLPCEFTRS
jgi:hypothetical protein